MPGLLLEDAEKQRFCDWLQFESETNRRMSEQLKAIGHDGKASKLNAVAMAQEIVRQDILSWEEG